MITHFIDSLLKLEELKAKSVQLKLSSGGGSASNKIPYRQPQPVAPSSKSLKAGQTGYDKSLQQQQLLSQHSPALSHEDAVWCLGFLLNGAKTIRTLLGDLYDSEAVIEKHVVDLLVLLDRTGFIDETSVESVGSLDPIFTLETVLALEGIFRVGQNNPITNL